jgi:hypothetical protein
LHPFLKIKTELGNYVQTHDAAITVLNMLGLRLSPRVRLDIFRLIIKLDREFKGRPEYEEARKLLDRLALMRQRGLEPRHKNGVYLPRNMDDLLK